jgi:hypothetical protein
MSSMINVGGTGIVLIIIGAYMLLESAEHI